MKIFKEHVIEALETEPLSWGRWIILSDYRPNAYSTKPASEEACTVCAVGAVFRKYSKRGARDFNVAVNEQVVGATEPGFYGRLPENWIAAMSFVWESLDKYNLDIPIEEARAHMIQWVEDNVPEDEILFKV